ncbi:hypothetical protein N9M78_06475, partial [Alphaproteobacteria bacterium]|nr:hypothetical protein [Alphaproteobacteria bacterium]
MSSISGLNFIGVQENGGGTYLVLELDHTFNNDTTSFSITCQAGEAAIFYGNVDSSNGSIWGENGQGTIRSSNNTNEVRFELPDGFKFPELALTNIGVSAHDDGMNTGANESFAFSSVSMNTGLPLDSSSSNYAGPEIVSVSLEDATNGIFFKGEFGSVDTSLVNHVAYEISRGDGQTNFGVITDNIHGDMFSSDFNYGASSADSWSIDKVTVVDSNGNVKSYKGVELEPDSTPYNYPYYVLDPTPQDTPFNIESFYYEAGDYISFDVEHENIESQLTYTKINSTWGDSLDWLSIDDQGSISGVAPTYFNSGGGNIVANFNDIYGNSNEIQTSFFTVDQRLIDYGGSVKIGNEYTNGRMSESVYFNSQDDDHVINFTTAAGDSVATANTIQMADGWTGDRSDFDQLRDGNGFQITTSGQNDYIDLSGYSQADFTWKQKFWKIETSVTPGNDHYIGPDALFAKGTDGMPVGLLNASSYFAAPYGQNLDKSEGLSFTFNNGNIDITDSKNSYQTDAKNVNAIQTSSLASDQVYGDDNQNIIISSGGLDTIYGGLGDDVFALNFDDYDAEVFYGMTLADYQRGEEVHLIDFGVESFSELSANIFYDENGAVQTAVSIHSSAGVFENAINVSGAWNILVSEDPKYAGGLGDDSDIAF